MKRLQVFLLIVVLVGMGLMATSASAQTTSSDSEMRFGVGASFTQINNGLLGKPAFMPVGILDFDKAIAEFGFYLRTGENETQFMLQIGGAYFPLNSTLVTWGLGFNSTWKLMRLELIIRASR